MDKIDFSQLPAWLAAVLFFSTGTIVPIVLAWIGRNKAKNETIVQPQVASTPVQIESPWLVIELNTISTVIQQVGRDVKDLIRAVDRMVILTQERSRRKD